MNFGKFLLTFSTLVCTLLTTGSSACTQTNELSGSISDSANGYFRSPQENCWIIVVPSGKVARINVTKLDFYDRDCTYSHLKFRMVATGEEHKYCTGNSTERLITATSNVIVTHYVYSSEFIFSCFELNYEIEGGECAKKDRFRCSNGKCIPRSRVCNGVKDCPNGEDEEGCDEKSDEDVDTATCVVKQEASNTIADSAEGYFRKSRKMCWVIVVPPNRTVRINVTRLDMYGENCIYGYLKLIVTATGEEYKYCNERSHGLITATSNVTISHYIYPYNFMLSCFNLNYDILQ